VVLELLVKDLLVETEQLLHLILLVVEVVLEVLEQVQIQVQTVEMVEMAFNLQ
jgi:hypothetical protein